MDFKGVLNTLIQFLEARQTPLALIGGLSMAAYGSPRTTLDLDLAVSAEIQDELVSFLESLGYETLYRSSGYSNHQHPIETLGRVDIVYLRNSTARTLFAEVRKIPGPGGLEVPVLKPEHLAAMKIFAMKNDASRRFRELADIQFLLSLPGVDREEIRRYFTLYGLEKDFEEIRKPGN